MALVHIPTPLRTLTAGASEVEVPGATVRAIVANLESRFPGMQARLVEDDRLRAGLAVFVDGANSRRRLRTKVDASSEVFFVESIGGGSSTSRRPASGQRMRAHRKHRPTPSFVTPTGPARIAGYRSFA